MRLVIEKSDFQRLSTTTQDELLRALSGRTGTAGAVANGGGAAVAGTAKKPRFRWRKPVDLTPDLTARLMHGLSDSHKERLKLFVEKGGRVSMKELLELTGDSDVRALSHFEGTLTRRLRRLLNDTEKVAYLIGWDYDSTKWSEDRTQIVDGTYYVSDATVNCLREYFEPD
jgi:hypothetical protein